MDESKMELKSDLEVRFENKIDEQINDQSERMTNEIN